MTKYYVQNGETYLRDGTSGRRIAHFTARIVEDRVLDDGMSEQRKLQIEAVVKGRKVRIEVPARDFASMAWVHERLGSNANIAAGRNYREHMRAAIQQLSVTVPERRTYSHTGWRRIAGVWGFLHSGGAIGLSGVETNLRDERLDRYVLPLHPCDPRGAVGVSLRILELGPAKILYPCLAAIYRAPLCHHLPMNGMLHLVGPTGSFKSTLAAAMLAPYGNFSTKEDLPARWAFTETSLEKITCLAKDVLLVIDDLSPEAIKGRRDERERGFARIIGAVGDVTGRRRSTSTLETRLEYYPRGLIVSTGEYTPNLPLSRQARLFPVPFELGAISRDKLTQYQTCLHVLPSAMLAYLEYLRRDFDAIGPRIVGRFHDVRAQVGSSSQAHARLAENVAHLYLGIETATQFAFELGAIDEYGRDRHRNLGLAALTELAEAHGKTLQNERPTQMFLLAIREALAQGKAWIGPRAPDASDVYFDTGEKIGWVDTDGVYLIPEAAFNLVNGRLNYRGGIHTSEQMLKRMLRDEGYLRQNPSEPDRFEQRKRCDGEIQRVLWLRPDALKDESAEEDTAP